MSGFHSIKREMSLFRKKKVLGYKLNWKPSPNDARDFRFKSLISKDAILLPISADVSAAIPEVFDQGSVGSCTGNAGQC
jgi:hypothetical protein